MSKRKHRLSRQSKPEDKQICMDDQIRQKRSLGILRAHQKTKPRSPDATGKFTFQRHTLVTICKQLKETGCDEVVCNIAGWKNTDHQGQYITVEISPRFVPREQRTPKPGLFDDIFETETELF
jgi:hypothetical protein